MSVIRLQSENKNRLLDLATKILNKWREYSDLEVDIIAMTADVPHHTVTPIARKVDGRYELDIVLRDNHTTEQYPRWCFSHPQSRCTTY